MSRLLRALQRMRVLFLAIGLLLRAPAASAAPPDVPRAASAAAEGIDPKALQQLLQGAEASKSSAVVILKNGKLVGEWSFGHAPVRIEAMSVTKSVVGLAVLKLLADGKIASLDVPLHTYFPEWNQGRKKDITLRHLLTHTSGLQSDARAEEIYRSPDFVKLALAAELTEPPGTAFRYNNKAVNLLAAVVQKASGKRLDRYLADALFRPMGITDFGWTLDDAGNPHVMAGVQLRPRDLAKLGQLMLDGGVWQGCRLLPAEWVKQATTPGEGVFSPGGLLWWSEYAWMRFTVDDALLDAWKKAGVPDALLQDMAPLKGRTFTDEQAYLDALGSRLPALKKEVHGRHLRLATVEKGPRVGFNANGYLGQYLLVVPEHRLVAVRMFTPLDETGPQPDESVSFNDFIPRALALVDVSQTPVLGEAIKARGAATPR
ncbi:class A beta-lactamase-related serine hydrolase [Corallococcus sp. CA053C]|uniref:serine hydrolase domain-containing protein n=1 Tax=Corallococcus sp. CA053C TaxID=2316732 RepID=UPI000EA3E714|nr:serine hydrolase domain-containing protein [Corallococcus sp. CA053C]RKH08837.1 class A beta-lactamase-related serine hydrolase [Corallococcus sp. CA053C]